MVLIKSKPESMMRRGEFPHAFNSILNSFFEESQVRTDNINFIPQADIVEKEKQYEINMSLPGIGKEDIRISVDRELLTVEGERKHAVNEDGKKFLKREISYGKFSRSFHVDKIDASKIEAEFTNGILNIVLPKLAEEPASTIVIK